MLKNIYFYNFISNSVNLRRNVSIIYNIIAVLFYCILTDFSSLIVVTKDTGLHGGLLLNTIPNFNTQTINQKRKFSSIDLYNNIESKSSKLGLIENHLNSEFVVIKGSTVSSEKQ